MIISHKHKFIFIKTPKTAGTSVEIALSQLCGEDDVITPIRPEDEAIRTRSEGRGPQNYRVPFKAYRRYDLADLLMGRSRVAFVNHTSASFVRDHLDPDCWESYFKFCFDRNPWDKVISFYYWTHREEPRPSISEFVQSGRASRILAFDLYAIRGEIVVDRVCRFENLEQEMKEVAQILGLPNTPSLPRAKSEFRRERRSYRELLSEQDGDKIAKVYAREIAHLGYEW